MELARETYSHYAQKLTKSRNGSVYLILSNHFEVPCYYFLKVAPQKESFFLKQLGMEVVLSDFGEILLSGYGEPTQKTLDEMKEKYNFIPKNS